jgi:beta-N-acetylhexosaminidase
MPRWTASQRLARLVGGRVPPDVPARARRVVVSVTSPISAHPRLAGSALAGLLLICLLVPLLSAFGSPRTPPPIAQITPTPTPTATHGATPAATARPTGETNLSWVTHLRSLAEQAYVDDLMSHMSLDEEIGQMVMIGFNGTEISPGVAALISQYHVGSAVLYAVTNNIANAAQTKKLVQDLQAQAKIPLLIATDQEGGGVNRLVSIIGPLPSAAEVGASNDPNKAKQRGEQDGQALASLGINVNFAPVVDVLNTQGGDIGPRAFGNTPQVVTTMAGAYLRGLQEGHHVVGTLKHFPGLGDVPTDPHNELYYLNRSLADLEAIDWAPYKSLIATGQVDMVMSTYVVVNAVDKTQPAALSKPVLTGILRDQLGFNGVIVTDGIYMKAAWQLNQSNSYAPIYLKAVQAGNDIICSLGSSGEVELFIQTIRDAIANGTLSKQQIDDSVRRILLLKLHYGVLAGMRGG